MNMLWTKGPLADFEILVYLYKVHTQLVFSIEQEEIHAQALYNGGFNYCLILYFKPARFLFRSAHVNKFILLKAGEKLIC